MNPSNMLNFISNNSNYNKELIISKIIGDKKPADNKSYIDDDFKLQGQWITYYPSGNVRIKVNYKNGLLHGERIVYIFNGDWFKENYINGLRHGEAIAYWAKEFYINGKRIK